MYPDMMMNGGSDYRSFADVQPRSGKSSISSVVFHKVPPSETLFLESTVRIQKDSMAYDTSCFSSSPQSLSSTQC